MSDNRRIHLVTYASPRFRHRQLLLALSAKANNITSTVTSWTNGKLLSSEFSNTFPDIHLTDRGSGYWAWKPFIIWKKLVEIPEGDIVFYSDVGRSNTYKLLNCSLDPIIGWMTNEQQEIMPGIQIPWTGTMAEWTKRDAFYFTETDTPEYHNATPIQSSFSFWIAGKRSRDFIAKWSNLCADRRLVSDDPSVCGLSELTSFRDHRHDQALLSLLCLKSSIQGMSLGKVRPTFDEKNASEVASAIARMPKMHQPPITLALHAASLVLSRAEFFTRSLIRFTRKLAR